VPTRSRERGCGPRRQPHEAAGAGNQLSEPTRLS